MISWYFGTKIYEGAEIARFTIKMASYNFKINSVDLARFAVTMYSHRLETKFTGHGDYAWFAIKMDSRDYNTKNYEQTRDNN